MDSFIKQIIQAIPDVCTITIPEPWWKTLPQDISVFQSLYRWLVETRKFDASGLHDRTYAGAGIMKRLLDFEKRRLASRTKLRGKELARAMMWANLDAGPQERFADRDIPGQILLVMPDDHESVSKASDAIWESSRHKHNKRIQALASGSNFRAWLLSNSGRQDPVGDIADDARHDAAFPDDVQHYEDLVQYIRSSQLWGNPTIHHALEEALMATWHEYAKRYPARIVRAAWCDHYTCHRQYGRIIQDLRHGVLAWSEDDDSFAVFHNDCVMGHPDNSIALASLVSTDVKDDPVLAFAQACEASDYALSELRSRLTLWGFHSSPPSSHGTVYFIQAGQGGPIKIGYTNGKVRQRLATLQVGHHTPLILLATIDGDKSLEKRLHQQFHASRETGEWFRPDPDLLQFIAEHKQTPRQGDLSYVAP